MGSGVAANGEGATLANAVPELHPPPSFACVSPHIYRSGDPTRNAASFAFLDTLRLKTIVLLSIEYPSSALAAYCERNDIELQHFGIDWRWPTPTCMGEHSAHGAMSHSLFLSPHEINSSSVLESIIKDGLETLLDTRFHPVLVLDTAGIFEAGTLLGCLRKMQGWNFASILVEYRSFAGSRSRSANERFIEVRFATRRALN